MFGNTFVAKLFAEGPFLLALLVSFLPVFLFLAISSVFRFGQEKNAGAVELLTYGPADGTAYLLASFIKDVAFAAASLLLITLFLWLAAAIGNLVLGPLFLLLLPVLLCASLAVFSYGVLCSILASNASSALAAFLGTLLLFLVVLAGSFSIASASVRTVSSVAAAIIQWFSPLFYTSMCVRAAQGGAAGSFLGGIGLMLVLSAALLGLSHLAVRRRGVRA
jgi:ABC-type multidrug transport system permease subunit